MSDIVLRNVSKRFDEKQVLQDFSHTFREGSFTCIMGPSGGGKTTLLNLLTGFISPDRGPIDGLPERIAVVFQEDRLCEDFSALTNIRMVTGKKLSDEMIRRELEELGLSGSIDQPVDELSGGMKRRVAIVRAILYDADLILFDEASKGLDEERKKQVLDYIRRKTAGKTVIYITHDPEEAAYFGGDPVTVGNSESE